MSLYKTLRITGIKTETADCKTFFLEPVGAGAIRYQPGQFLTFVFPKPAGEERRSYSISSTPALQEPVSVTIKKVENGEYSRKLVDHARVGNELITIGANGFFVLPSDIKQNDQVFFLAAGSGITPVFSLIKTLLIEHPHVELVLIYSNRSRSSTIFYEELQRLQNQHKGRLLIEFLFSSSYYLERARLSKWLLGILLKQYLHTPLSKTLFYCCGPLEFMRMATIQLLEDGVPQQHIRKEHFSTFKQEIKIKPPDTEKHAISIRIGADHYSIESQYPQTILQAAKKAGIVLPYSCEAGKCGSCAANCISGKVWMSYNEVLLDEEIAKGRVLTCTGFPVGGDVVVDYG